MKKRKFLSLFAILFVAIFAMSVCFFAACKGGSNDDENGDEEGTTQTDPNPNTGTDEDDDGSEDEYEEEPRTGDSIDAEAEIIGTWIGDVTIRAELLGYGGTIESEMTVVITAEEGFTLSFTTVSITYDAMVGLLGLEDYVNGLLEDAGIVEGGEPFEMFSEMPVYEDETGYFADIDGDYTTCQVSLEVVDGLLCIDFDETMTFGSFPIEIIFDAKLYSEAELAIEKIIDLADKELTYPLGDGTTATFANDESLSIRTTDGISYAVSGTASKMGEAEAAYYGTSDIQEGALYVVLKIAVPEGGSITFGYSQKTYVNSDDGDTDEFDEDGYIYVIQALRDENDDGVYDERDFTIKTAEEEDAGTKYIVTFEGVTEPEEAVEWIVSVTADDEDIVDNALTIEVGDTVALQGAAVQTDGTEHGLYTNSTWESSDESVATVEIKTILGMKQYKSATLTAVGAGTTVITFTIPEGASFSFTVTVEATLVKIYDDTIVGFGSGDNTADFKNAHDLEIVTTTDENGAVCSIEGMATLFTEEQATAFGGGATKNDAYVVVKIPASVGCTVTFNGVEEIITEDPTSGVYILGVRTGTTSNPMEVKITDEAGNTVSEFKISIANLVIPDDVIEGVWTGNVSASAIYSGTTYSATADVTLAINVGGTLSITITNISTGDSTTDALISALVTEVTLPGTWSVTDGEYTFAITAGSGVEVEENGELAIGFAPDNMGETQATMSFDITYTVYLFGSISLGSIQITVSNGTLVMG